MAQAMRGEFVDSGATFEAGIEVCARRQRGPSSRVKTTAYAGLRTWCLAPCFRECDRGSGSAVHAEGRRTARV